MTCPSSAFGSDGWRTVLGGEVEFVEYLQASKVPTGRQACPNMYVFRGRYLAPGHLGANREPVECILKGVHVKVRSKVAKAQLCRISPLVHFERVMPGGPGAVITIEPPIAAVPIDYVVGRRVAVIPHVGKLNLRDALRQGVVQPSIEFRATLMRRLALCISIARRAALAHRDLADNNVMLVRRGEASWSGVVIDWDEGLWGTGVEPMSNAFYPWTHALSVIFQARRHDIDSLALIAWFVRLLVGDAQPLVADGRWWRFNERCACRIETSGLAGSVASPMAWLCRRVARAISAIESGRVAYDDIPGPEEYIFGLMDFMRRTKNAPAWNGGA